MAHEIITGKEKRVPGARSIDGIYRWSKTDEAREQTVARRRKFLARLQDNYGDTGAAASGSLIRLRNEFYGDHKSHE